jgi:hypothetical protein
MRITKKDALMSTRIKFVMIRIVVMKKRNTTKDFGGNRKGIFARLHLKGRLTFKNMREHPIQKICGNKNDICPKKLMGIHL